MENIYSNIYILINSAVRGGNIYFPCKMLANYISVSNSSIYGKHFHANSGKLFIFSLNFPFAEFNFTFKNNILINYFNSIALYVYKPDFEHASTLILLEILEKKIFLEKIFSYFIFLFELFFVSKFYTSSLQLCNSKLF